MPIERTFVAIKPDAVQRGLIGKIVTRFEEKGFKIIAMKMLKLPQNKQQVIMQNTKENHSTTD